MNTPQTSLRTKAKPTALVRRGVMFFALWLILLPSFVWYDVLIGLLFTLAATLSSVALLPPATTTLKLWPLLRYLPRFMLQSLLAGWDIARRVFSPKMRLAPGFIQHKTILEPGIARSTFATITSLTPGTVPCDTKDTAIIYHVLDHQQDNAGQLQREEQQLGLALNGASRPS